MKNTLSTKGLCYFSGTHTLLKNINFSFEAGKIYALLGPNGSGKTTLLRLLSSIWQPSAGAIFWNENDLQSYDRITLSRLISFVPQNQALSFDYTVEEIVRMGRFCHGERSPLKKNRDVIEEALHLTDIEHLRDCAVTEISGGEVQRVLIARALATESAAILLDEPTNNLDIRHEQQVWQILHSLKEQGKLVIIANHNLHRSYNECDEVILLNYGECVAYGPSREVLTSATINLVYEVECAL